MNRFGVPRKPGAPAPRIAVIGGGIAGLVCLHALRTGGAEARLFEASTTVGGRIKTFRDPQGRGVVELGAGYFHRYYRALHELLRTLGLEPYIVRKHGRGIAFLPEGAARGDMVRLGKRSGLRALARGRLGPADLWSLLRVTRFARTGCSRACEQMAALGGRDLGVHEALLHDDWYAAACERPFADFLQQLSPTIAELVRAVCRKQLFQEADTLSLATGAFLAGSLAVPQHTLKPGMDMLPRRLGELHQERIVLATPVVSVREEGPGWQVTTAGAFSGVEHYDAVVLAVPWPAAARLASTPSDAFASRGQGCVEARVLVLSGRLRPSCDGVDSLYVLGRDTAIYGLTHYGGGLFKAGAAPGADVDATLTHLFTDYTVLHEQVWQPGLPDRRANTRVPPARLRPGLYLAGDQAVPCLEASVLSGLQIARALLVGGEPGEVGGANGWAA